MRKIKVTYLLLALMVTIKSYAQWNPLGPKTTNADLNIGGMQFGRFHIKHNQLPLMAAEIGGASNGHQNVYAVEFSYVYPECQLVLDNNTPENILSNRTSYDILDLPFIYH